MHGTIATLTASVGRTGSSISTGQISATWANRVTDSNSTWILCLGQLLQPHFASEFQNYLLTADPGIRGLAQALKKVSFVFINLSAFDHTASPCFKSSICKLIFFPCVYTLAKFGQAGVGKIKDNPIKLPTSGQPFYHIASSSYKAWRHKVFSTNWSRSFLQT